MGLKNVMRTNLVAGDMQKALDARWGASRAIFFVKQLRAYALPSGTPKGAAVRPASAAGSA